MECRNCKTKAFSESAFCTNCGEKIPFKRLTTKSFIAIAFSQFLDIDNKLFRTFKKLFTHPEIVIDDYIKGFRKKFVNVIGYLGLAITLLGLQFFILKKFYPELLSVNMGTIKNDAFDMQKVIDTFYDYQGLFTIALIPIYALVSRFVFIDTKKYNLAEHFVINSYITAQTFIASFFIVIIAMPLGLSFNLYSQLLIIPLYIYMAFVYKKLYNMSTLSTTLRTIAYAFLSFFILMGIILVIAIFVGIYMGYTGQIPVKTI